MPLLLEIGGALVAGTAGVVGGSTALVVHRLRRANRLPAAKRVTPAPTAWLWSFRRAAVMHRRLQGVCELARASAPSAPRRRRRGQPAELPSPLERVAEELIDQAVTVDGRLISADRLAARWRRPALAGIESELRSLEASATRLAGLAATMRRDVDEASRPTGVDVERQLDAVEAALGELRA